MEAQGYGGALQGLRRSRRAARIGRSSWGIHGTTERPQRLLLIVAGGVPREFELRLQTAVRLLAEREAPADLMLCDPPWALRRGRGHFADGNGYHRDQTRVLPGCVDVEPDRYLDFHPRLGAAGGDLRVSPGQVADRDVGPEAPGRVPRAALTGAASASPGIGGRAARLPTAIVEVADDLVAAA
jgi:hypothetical protein